MLAAVVPLVAASDIVCRELARSSGGRLVLQAGACALEVCDTYAPALGGAARVGGAVVCEVVAPKWLRAAQERARQAKLLREASDPRTEAFQRRHSYFGLSPNEVDEILRNPFDKHERLSEAFMRDEGLGPFAFSRPSSLRQAALARAKDRRRPPSDDDDDFDEEEDGATTTTTTEEEEEEEEDDDEEEFDVEALDDDDDDEEEDGDEELP